MDDVQLFDELSLANESNAFICVVELMDVLDCKLAQISQEARISRADASALVDRFGVTYGERYPLASFTEQPSGTNVTAALEGIVSKASTYLMDLLKAAWQVLVKIFDWIIGFFGFTRDRERRIQRYARNFEQVDLAIKKLRATKITPVSTTEMDEARRVFNERYSGLWPDMLGSGQILKLIRSLEMTTLTLQEDVDTRVDALRDAVASGKPLKHKGPVTSYDRFSALFQRSEIGRSIHGKTAKELMSAFNGYVTQQSLQNEHADTDPLNTITALLSRQHGILAPIQVTSEVGARSMRETLSELKTMPTFISEKLTPDDQKSIQVAITELLDDAMAVQLYYNVLNLYSHSRDMMFTALWQYVSSYYRALYTAASASTDFTIRRVAEETSHVLKTRLIRR